MRFIGTFFKQLSSMLPHCPFVRCTSGAAAIIFGLVLIPVVGLVGAAIDYSRALNARTVLQDSLDAVVLAVAAATNMTEEERMDLGQKTFQAEWQNQNSEGIQSPQISIDRDVSTGEDTVTAQSTGFVQTTFLNVMKLEQIDLGATSAAITIKASPICLLALNKTAQHAIDIQGGASLTAVGCAVHANSHDESAIRASGSSNATAEQFCAIGGHDGDNFTPKPRRCGYVEDPYKDMMQPFVGSCDYTHTRVKKQDGATTLSPGVYCGGIDIQTQATVTFLSGLYIIKDGGLTFSSGSTVTGEGVTFYFTGDNTVLTVISSATVDLSAPTSGPYEGFVFIQDPDSNAYQLTGKTNEIQGGGSIKIVGTVYFPTQPMTISGNGAFGVNSPLMPIIADTILVTGSGAKTIQLDQTAANMWQDLPKANDGARLIN